LRQLVEAGSAQESARAFQAIDVRGPDCYRDSLPHRSKLENDEGFAIETGTALSKQHRSAHQATDDEGDERQHGRQQAQSNRGDAEIEKPLADAAIETRHD
jgi:hypothetical protein